MKQENRCLTVLLPERQVQEVKAACASASFTWPRWTVRRFVSEAVRLELERWQLEEGKARAAKRGKR